MSQSTLSLKDELASSILHGVGALLSFLGAMLLLVYGLAEGDRTKLVSFAIYGSSLVILFSISTLYHSFQTPKLKRLFLIFDHCAIYLLIAGTYTPFLLVGLQGELGWSLFLLVWGLASFGILLKLFFFDKTKYFSLASYVGLGWIIVFVANDLSARISPEAFRLLFIGGCTYTLGVLFFVNPKIPYHHSIWHLFVLGGGACHFLAIYLYVGGY